MIKKIVIVGPESAGKSTLCQQLAEYYSSGFVTECCPEYAREFLNTHGNDYNYDDLLTIARVQLSEEDRITRELNKRSEGKAALLFIDTDMTVMKVWSEFVFNKIDPFILDQVAVRVYDLYLLCNVDLPWEKDPLREYPDLKRRELLFGMYKDILINQPVPWALISGTKEERLKAAVNAVDKLL
jgi:NadR type nicotinamide-nucleotide adenylyltransferase